ncbi:MAG: enoyl-CoA hydratase/isomerase family protein [Planctomycetes bacterium]|nr:enoyl-CoA hydratase/isomerase family protein [Planctomycetota bacterium]
MTTTHDVVRTAAECDGSLVRLVLARPKGNVLDAAMVGRLRELIADATASPRVTTLMFQGEGSHFSFGASVDEHRREHVAAMLHGFHALFRELIASSKVVLAAVRGQCLGGGLELAAFAHRVFAAPDAQLGCPEVKLGVFAPVGAIVLPWRMGQARGDALLLSGAKLAASDALAQGLVDEIADDPAAAAVRWHTDALQASSAVAVRHTARAARERFHRAFVTTLDVLERQYLDELVPTHDANEGIAAFLDKRSPVWTHR